MSGTAIRAEEVGSVCAPMWDSLAAAPKSALVSATSAQDASQCEFIAQGAVALQGVALVALIESLGESGPVAVAHPVVPRMSARLTRTERKANRLARVVIVPRLL